MFGKNRTPGLFNIPVVCKVSEESVNDAFQSLNRQLNDIVSPVVTKNFDKETGKILKATCGEFGPAATSCIDVLDWDSDISSGLEDGRVASILGVTYDNLYLIWWRQTSGSDGRMSVHVMGNNGLPASTTPAGHLTSTDYLGHLGGLIAIDPTDYNWATYSAIDSELRISNLAGGSTISVKGSAALPVDPGSHTQPTWTSDGYIILPTGQTTDMLYIIDATDVTAPVLLHTISSSDSALTSMKSVVINRDENVFYVAGSGGVEAWHWGTRGSAPTKTSHVASAVGYDTLTYSENENWLFVAQITSTTNLAYVTIDIDPLDADTITVNTNGSITDTFLADEVIRNMTGMWTVPANETSVAATAYKTSTSFKVYVFNLSDLTDVSIEEVEESIAGTLIGNPPFYVHRFADADQQAAAHIWTQVDYGVVVEHWFPETIQYTIPCRMQIGQIEFTLVDPPCTDIRVMTGIPAGHPIITNLNADKLDDQHGTYFLDSDNFTGTEWTDLTDGGETELHIHPIVVHSTSSDLTLTAAHQHVRADSTSATVTITLPAADAQSGRHYWVKKTAAANVVNIVPDGADTIEEGAGLTIVFKGDTAHFVSDGVSDWSII